MQNSTGENRDNRGLQPECYGCVCFLNSSLKTWANSLPAKARNRILSPLFSLLSPVQMNRFLRFLLCAFCGLLLLLGTAVSEAAESAPNGKPTFWLIPHTHWEGAVFKTREEYLDMGLPNILTVLRLLKEHPNYRFVLDQVAYFKPFLERYPEEAQPVGRRGDRDVGVAHRRQFEQVADRQDRVCHYWRPHGQSVRGQSAACWCSLHGETVHHPRS